MKRRGFSIRLAWNLPKHNVTWLIANGVCPRLLSLSTGTICFPVQPKRGGDNMETILIIVLLVVLFGGGGGYYWSRRGR